MRPRIFVGRFFWIALSASRGWPRRARRAWIGRNERYPSTRHVGFILLGVCVELRFGPSEGDEHAVRPTEGL